MVLVWTSTGLLLALAAQFVTDFLTSSARDAYEIGTRVHDQLRESCAPSCSAADRDALSSKLVVANVTFGVGIVALVAAATTWVLTAR